MKVLVIDDDRVFLRAMRVPLERDGFTLLTTGDGLSGLALLRSESCDLVLLNALPSGLDICRQMRRISDVPLIMFGSPKPEDVIGSLAAGADDYVLQPSSQYELMARVHAVLRRAAWQMSINQTRGRWCLSDKPDWVSERIDQACVSRVGAACASLAGPRPAPTQVSKSSRSTKCIAEE